MWIFSQGFYFRETVNLKHSQKDEITLLLTDVGKLCMPSHTFSTCQIYLLRLFVKIKFSQKCLTFQHLLHQHFAYWVILHAFCCLRFFSKSTFSKNSFRNTIRVSNSLDPDQARHFVRPDLATNCLQKLSADDASR